jgi:hypothetical protein
MVSAFNGLTWFLFVGLYMRATWGMPVRPLPVQLWDWALLLMLVASGGALGLMAMVFTGAENIFLQQLFLHQFLDLFATGWFNLGLLGVAWSFLALQADGEPLPGKLPTMSLALLLAPTFLLGMSPAVVPPHLFWVAALANAGAALLLGVHLLRLWQRRGRLPAFAWLALAALLVILVAALLILLPGVWQFGASGQLRIFYLHDLLLGWVSTLLLLLIQARFIPLAPRAQAAINWLWAGGVLVMLVALLGFGLASYLPVPGLFWLQVAAWASVAVATAAVLLWVTGLLALRK